jgi:type I restriction enzyme, S subunit
VTAVLAALEPSARYLEAVQPALVRHFELVATAPGGVARLRELILSLAVQGKLTKQDCDEETASVLLDRIRDRKLRLISSGVIKQGKQPTAVDDVEPMFELPKGWTWASLGELCSYIQRGKGPAYSEQSEHKVVSQKCVRWHGLDLAPARFVTTESFAKYEPVRFLRAGDLLWNSTGTGTIGRACVVPIELDDAGLVADSHVTVVRPLEVNSLFLWRWIQSPFVQDEIEGSASGTTNQIELNTSTVVNQPVPLPPLAEQVRIVARVDELMRLCDALEAKGRLEAEQHARLLGTLLGTLTDSGTPEELAASWQRVADHFDLLLDRPEAVDALEQTILQLAVRGLLAQQDPSDESASELVRRIRSYRDEQVKLGLAKRERPFTPLSEAGHPFQLPTGWEWIRFDDLIEPAKPISYGVLVPGPDIDRGVPFVRIADLSLTDPPAKPEKSISTEVDAQYQRTRLEGGEILMGVVGSIGKLGVAPPTWAGANIARAICRIVPVGLVDYGFVLLLLQSEFMRDSFAGDTRTLAQPTLNVGLIRSSATPLPPIAEQARIVARVNEIRRLCADLRLRLAASQTTQSHLAEALVDMAVA